MSAALTLLWRPTQHTWKRRLIAPNGLHPRILVLPPLQPRYPLRMLDLYLLNPNHVGLQPPGIVVAAIRGEGLALRIHRLVTTCARWALPESPRRRRTSTLVTCPNRSSKPSRGTRRRKRIRLLCHGCYSLSLLSIFPLGSNSRAALQQQNSTLAITWLFELYASSANMRHNDIGVSRACSV